MDKNDIYINLKTNLIDPCLSTHRTIGLFTNPPKGKPLAPTMRIEGRLLGDPSGSVSTYLDSFSGKVVYPLNDREHNSILEGVTVLSHEIAHWLAQLRTPMSMYPILGGEVEDYEPHEYSVSAEMHALSSEYLLNQRLEEKELQEMKTSIYGGLTEQSNVFSDFIIPQSGLYRKKFDCLNLGSWYSLLESIEPDDTDTHLGDDPETEYLHFEDFDHLEELFLEDEWKKIFEDKTIQKIFQDYPFLKEFFESINNISLGETVTNSVYPVLRMIFEKDVSLFLDAGLKDLKLLLRNSNHILHPFGGHFDNIIQQIRGAMNEAKQNNGNFSLSLTLPQII
jgi:hypothetical protein